MALSAPERQAQMREILAPRIQAIENLGTKLGVGEVSLLRVSNADEFGRVPNRLDADELGLAARLEAATSRRHRHLLLLGVHAGVASALADMRRGGVAEPAPGLHRPPRDVSGRAAGGVGARGARGTRRHAEGADWRRIRPRSAALETAVAAARAAGR